MSEQPNRWAAYSKHAHFRGTVGGHVHVPIFEYTRAVHCWQ
jgi:hypothetical protein